MVLRGRYPREKVFPATKHPSRPTAGHNSPSHYYMGGALSFIFPLGLKGSIRHSSFDRMSISPITRRHTSFCHMVHPNPNRACTYQANPTEDREIRRLYISCVFLIFLRQTRSGILLQLRFVTEGCFTFQELKVTLAIGQLKLRCQVEAPPQLFFMRRDKLIKF